MPVAITAVGSDAAVLDQVAVDGGFPVTVNGNVRNAIEQVAADAGVAVPAPGNDRNAIEALAAALSAYQLVLAAPGFLGGLASAMAINGLTASRVAPAGGEIDEHAATGDVAVAIGWQGRRALEFGISATGSGYSYVEVGFTNDELTAGAAWRWRFGTADWAVVVNGVVQNVYAGVIGDAVAVVVAGDGTLEFWRSGVLAESHAGLFNGQSIFPRTLLWQTGAEVEGESVAVEFIPRSATSNYGGAGDWYGVAL